MAPRAVILGCSGPDLTRVEARFLADSDPWGFILFARNVETPAQVTRLTAELRATVGRAAPVLVDQEGGRVQRLRAPHWREWRPALDECARLPDPEVRARAMRLRSALIARDLAAVGIDVNCSPVLDLVRPSTNAIIRDRAYGTDAADVARIGRAVAEGLLSGGVLPVMKHIPGQGRADLDTHLALPRVEEDPMADAAPFMALADLPMAMTAHVVYAARDPERPATQSPAVIAMIRSEIGFDGLLMTDDLSMQALGGSFAERASLSLAAGVDMLLHCNGRRDEAADVVGAAPRLSGRAAARAEAALAFRKPAEAEDGLDAAYAALAGGAHAG